MWAFVPKVKIIFSNFTSIIKHVIAYRVTQWILFTSIFETSDFKQSVVKAKMCFRKINHWISNFDSDPLPVLDKNLEKFWDGHSKQLVDSTSNIVLACVERVKEVQISTTKLSKPKGKKEAGKGDIFIATRGADCSQPNRKRSRDFTLRFYHIWQSNYAISNCSFLCFLFNCFLHSGSISKCTCNIKSMRFLKIN